MSEERFPDSGQQDKTISLLLTHLHHMRESVPVNYKLKAELKQRLLEQMRQQQRKSQSVKPTQPKMRGKWLGAAIILLALVISISLYRHNSHVISLDTPTRLALSDQLEIEQVALSPTGDQLAYLEQNGKLTLFDVQLQTPLRSIRLPSNEGDYTSLSWSKKSSQLGLVEQAGITSRLWIVRLGVDDTRGSSRLIQEVAEGRMGLPTWSPDDRYLAYSLTRQGKQEIWISSTQSLQAKKVAAGHTPEFSPDGSKLAFVNEGKIYLLYLETGEVQEIGVGSWPSWITDSRLTFTDSGVLVEVQLVGESVQSVSPLLSLAAEEQLQRAYWSRDGKHVLLTSFTDTGARFSIAARD